MKITQKLAIAVVLLCGITSTTLYAMDKDESTKLWMKCCENQPVGLRCSDKKTRSECYYACQTGCGSVPSSKIFQKCRQFCDIAHV